MKIEIELKEIRREVSEFMEWGDLVRDVETLSVGYAVIIDGNARKAGEFAVILPLPGCPKPGDELLEKIVRDRFAATIRDAIRNAAIVDRVRFVADKSERDALKAMANGKFQKAAALAERWEYLKNVLNEFQKNPFRRFRRLAMRAKPNHYIETE